MSVSNEIQRLQTAKADLKTAIEAKGVAVSSAATLDAYADYVDDIEQGGGLDFTTIGYSSAESTAMNDKLAADLAYSKTLYDAWDPSYTSAYGLYANNKQLVYAPKIDTSNVQDMRYMFNGCVSLSYVPQYNTDNVAMINNMFVDCTLLKSIPEINGSNLISIGHLFGEADMTLLTDFGGFIGLKKNWNDNYGLAKCPNLTVQSLLNVLNGLYDFTGHGETPTSSQGNLQLGQANYDKLTAEQIAIGTAKGWTITA